MQFHFELMPLDEISPWGTTKGDLVLDWFGLTMGWFWIEVEGQELFRYSQEIRTHWARIYPDVAQPVLPYENYQVARYWEDWLEMLPAILDPVPDDLAERVGDTADWQALLDRLWARQETSGNESVAETCEVASHWWKLRTYSAGHLAHPPGLWVWRVGDVVRVRWDNRAVRVDSAPVWAARQGEVTMPMAEFVEAVRSFSERLLGAMQERVDAVRTSWSRPEVAIDLASLEREQRERAGWFAANVRPWVAEVRRPFPWEQVRAALAAPEAATMSVEEPV